MSQSSWSTCWSEYVIKIFSCVKVYVPEGYFQKYLSYWEPRTPARKVPQVTGLELLSIRLSCSPGKLEDVTCPQRLELGKTSRNLV